MTTPTTLPPRKTLGITGITIHAMALVAPGTFAWMLYQAQAAGAQSGMGAIWPGVLAALGAALLSALSFSELARRYANTNLRSAYHFAEQVFREAGSGRPRSQQSSLPVRLAKFATGWAAHLYYWVYPGVMVAFTGILVDYLLRQLGYSPKPLGQVILALSFAAFIGFLALRGITGTMPSSIILNTIQLTTLIGFSILALVFRFSNPMALAPNQWQHGTLTNALLPGGVPGVIFQAALAMFLMVGFEGVTSLRAQSANPVKDLPRAAILALVLQGVFAYLLVYLATGLAMNNFIDAVKSTAPLGDLALQIGDSLLRGNGFSLMFVVAFAAIIALLGALLTALNNAVRISFAMALDAEMPDLLGVINPSYITPVTIVVALCVTSAILGALGILGGLPVLIGLILASNLGAFILYALLCILTISAFRGTPEFNPLRHLLLPLLGLALNLLLAIAAPIIAIAAGGLLATAAWVALSIAAIWLLVSMVYYFLRQAR
jgi:APA family basic amino acid/polyamine antiporter